MKKIMETVLNKITDHKASGDLILSTSKSLKLSAQDKNLSEYKVSSSQVLGLRLIKDGKVGISYTEALDDDSLTGLIQQALENAEGNDESLNEKILSLSGSLTDHMLAEESETPLQEKIAQVLKLEETPKSRDPKVLAVPYNGYSEDDYESLYMSSTGRYCHYKDKSYQIWTSVLMGQEGKKSSFSDFDLAHRFSDLKWDKVIETSMKRSQDFLQQRVIPTGKYAIVFTPDCLKNLIGVFSHVFSAKSALDKTNPWLSKVGEEVSSKNISIIDHPTFERSFRISLFDGEGVERLPLSLIKDGRLESFYHNSYTANHFKTKTTGHGVRGPYSSLGISGTDLVIQGKNPQSMPDRYLEIHQLDGLHAGTNRITGEFSLPIKGYALEKGQIMHAVGNVTLSGNFFELLKDVMVASPELEASTDQSFFSSKLLFNDLSIAGS